MTILTRATAKFFNWLLSRLPQHFLTYVRSRILWLLGISLEEISILDPRIIKNLDESSNFLPHFQIAQNLLVNVPSGHAFYVNQNQIKLLVKESSTWSAVFASNEHGFIPKQTKNIQTLAGIQCAIPVSNNYYHWLFDELPFTLCVINQDTNKSVNFVKCGGLKKYQTDVNEYLGLVVHEVEAWIKPQQILIPNQRHISGYPTSELLEMLRKSILKEENLSLNSNGYIYISRKRSSRSLPNENYYEELLMKEGFEILLLEELDFRTQVSYFHNAKVIVGAHGAGLANLAWANPGTKVFELIPDDFYNPCYLYLASKLGLEHQLVKISDCNDVLKSL